MTELIKSNEAFHQGVDGLQLAMKELPQLNCPLRNTFTQGMYVREIFMPKGSLIVSKIHLTEHQYFVLKGKATVFTDDEGTKVIEAPFSGVTKAGTRRVLYIHEDCVWATAHPTMIKPVDDSEEAINAAVAQIEDEIILKRDLQMSDKTTSFLKVLNDILDLSEKSGANTEDEVVNKISGLLNQDNG